MTQTLYLLNRYGYLILFASVFLESIGVPIPALPFVIIAGAASAVGTLKPWLTVLIAFSAMLTGDSLLYFLGRKTGWWILAILCRLSANPETCILRSAESFYRRGRLVLVIAKFIPGVNTVAPPLAGSLRMRGRQFVAFDFLGTALYLLPFYALGFYFSRGIERVINGVHSLGQIALWILVLAALIYMIYRIRLYRENRLYRAVPRISVEELAEKLRDPSSSEVIMVADARSHGYYEKGTTRIKGSIRLEPASIEKELEQLPRDKEIYLYCT